jgi:hypothetical protein
MSDLGVVVETTVVSEVRPLVAVLEEMLGEGDPVVPVIEVVETDGCTVCVTVETDGPTEELVEVKTVEPDVEVTGVPVLLG